MDEVGRGTTVSDGLAIAFATVHHLVTVNHCRALFATHFHELADMLGRTEDNKGQGRFENVAFYCSDVDETEVSHRQHTTRPHELTNEIDRMGTLHTPIA
jgi:DNA mismatch repair ATPase MutS